MTTWQNFNAGTGQGVSGAAVTRWIFDSARGWLNEKQHHDNTGPSCTYTPAGRLALRTWARGTNTPYSYDHSGDLSGVNYSDSTSDVTYTYDRRSRQTTMAAGGVTATRVHNDAGQLRRETYSGGPLNNVGVRMRTITGCGGRGQMSEGVRISSVLTRAG